MNNLFLAGAHRTAMRKPAFAAIFACLLAAPVSGSAIFHRQQYSSFTTPTPLPPGSVLVLGFMGAREAWNAAGHGVRDLCLDLRDMHLPNVYVETIENSRRDLALELIRKALDRNHDGKLDAAERASARIILYGHSFGGAAIVKLAHELRKQGIPVLLSIQVDSVGFDDSVIPSNVRAAANFYQPNGPILRGQSHIRASDPEKTTILANVRLDYRGRPVNESALPWFERKFAGAHAKIDADPVVWNAVRGLILEQIYEPERLLARRTSSGM